MFTIEEIKAAHAKVKSGADFPQYIQAMKQLGVKRYEHYLTDGHVTYYGAGQFTLAAPAKWTTREIADAASGEQVKRFLEAHQQGQSDYPTICIQLAGAGVEKWIVDLDKMTCTYYDKKENELLLELIPQP